MNISKRLLCAANMIEECNCLADIGTDHGYIPAYAVINKYAKKAIASDINSGPLKIADRTFKRYGISNNIELREGDGLDVLKEKEADIIVIAGMGGNLIADILNKNIKIAKEAVLILQPMQYPEIVRKYLSSSCFDIVKEDIVKEDNKFYHTMKAIKGSGVKYDKDVYYYTGLSLIQSKHPVLKEYVIFKINQINNIILGMPKGYEGKRLNELIKLKNEFEEVLKWL